MATTYAQELRAIDIATAGDREVTEYMLSWFDAMIRDEAKAVEDYGTFETLLEEAARKFESDRTFAEYLRGTAINVGQIIVDEQKHHSTFMKLRTELQTFPRGALSREERVWRAWRR